AGGRIRWSICAPHAGQFDVGVTLISGGAVSATMVHHLAFKEKEPPFNWAPPSVGHHARGARHSDLSRERSSQQGCPTHGEQIFASAPSQPLAGGALTRSSLIFSVP